MLTYHARKHAHIYVKKNVIIVIKDMLFLRMILFVA